MMTNNISETRVLICDFHREQAWERWIRKLDNDVGDERSKALTLMRAVARADDERTYKMALQNLKSSNIWQKNLKLQRYFTNVWLTEKEVSYIAVIA